MKVFTWRPNEASAKWPAKRTLADICADTTERGRTEWPGLRSGAGFPHADPKILEWSYRFPLICNILSQEIRNDTIYCLHKAIV